VQPITFALVHEGHSEWVEAGDLAWPRSGTTLALQLRDSAGLRSHQVRPPPASPFNPLASGLGEPQPSRFDCGAV
jgi:hypothetical protein